MKTPQRRSFAFILVCGIALFTQSGVLAQQPPTAPAAAPTTVDAAPPPTPVAESPAVAAAPVVETAAQSVVADPAVADALSAEPAAQEPVTATPNMSWSAEPGKGVTASLDNGSFEMNIRGRFMLRSETVAPKGESAETTVMVRRARLKVQGYAFSENVEYLMQIAFAQRDFESGNASPLYDAYLNLTHLRDLNVKIGQYIVPHDRARVISSSAAQLVDRSPVVSAFNMGRDVGFQLYSEDLFGLGGVLGYQLGIFGGEGRNARGFTGGLMYTARVQVAPFGSFDDYEEADIERDPAPRLAIGLGAAYNQKSHRPDSNQGTPYEFATFNTTHLEADMMFKVAGFSMLAEVMYRGADKDRVTNEMGDMEYSQSGWGWFAQAGYMLTDHFEVAGRYSQIESLKGTDPDFDMEVHGDGEGEHGIGHEAIGGLSWYAEGHLLKLQADYGYLFGDDAGNGTHEVRVQGQLQF